MNRLIELMCFSKMHWWVCCLQPVMLVTGGVQNQASKNVDGSEIRRSPPGMWLRSALNTGISTTNLNW